MPGSRLYVLYSREEALWHERLLCGRVRLDGRGVEVQRPEPLGGLLRTAPFEFQAEAALQALDAPQGAPGGPRKPPGGPRGGGGQRPPTTPWPPGPPSAHRGV